MKINFRTLTGAISTLVVLCVLFIGMGLDAQAQGNSRWGRSHNRGRHLGWTRGRRVGQNRNNWNWRRQMRRNRRTERREVRREVRRERRSNWDNNRNWRTSRNMQTGNWRRRH